MPYDTPYQVTEPPQLHARPTPVEGTDWVPTFWYSSFGQLSRELSPGVHIERHYGGAPALDVNAFGQVPDSLWFENRIGRRRLSLAEVIEGPNHGEPPQKSVFLVERGSTGGVTPGFVVKDARGQRWVVKFDHPAFPELTSGAEIVSTKLLYAAGYHVPENRVETVNVNAFELAEYATTHDDYRRVIPFTESALRQALDQLNPSPEGQLRAVFSKVLPGVPLGPFSLHGMRPDDPNDAIPHERRRSLRGLWLFYAWLNNTDAKYTNSLDVFIEQHQGQGYVRHYLIDFGTSLGATPEGPKPLKEGYEHSVDWASMGRGLAHLGISYPYWVTLRPTPLRAVGNFESAVFDPPRWRPVYPNPTFEASDLQDDFWAASILAHLGPLEVAAAVSAAHYSEHGASEYITETLLERRSKLLRHAFGRLTPLDRPSISRSLVLSLVDLEVLAGLGSAKSFEYRWQLAWRRSRGRPLEVSAQTLPAPRAPLEPIFAWLRQVHGRELDEQPYFSMSWSRRPKRSQRWQPEVVLYLRLLPDGEVLCTGIERKTH